MKKAVIVFLLMGLLTACGGNKKEDNTQNQVRPTDVVVKKVVLSNIDDFYTLPGVVEAWDDITVPSETSGPVTWIGKEEGDFVEKGEAILKINTDNLLANLNSAKVQLEDDKKELQRQKNLFAQKAVSQKQYDTAKKVYDLSQVSYKLALDEYNKSTIKSPVKGIIDNVAPKIGEYVSPGTEVARLVDISKLKIYINVPENDVKYLSVGQKVAVYVAEIGKDNAKENIKEGVINYVSVVSDPATLTHKVRVDVDIDKNIRPGRIVRVDIIRQSFQNVMVVDMYSLIDRDGEKIVYVNKDNKAEERKVIIGEMIGDKAIIISGIEPDDELIVKGHQFLVNGASIRVGE